MIDQLRRNLTPFHKEEIKITAVIAALVLLSMGWAGSLELWLGLSAVLALVPASVCEIGRENGASSVLTPGERTSGNFAFILIGILFALMISGSSLWIYTGPQGKLGRESMLFLEGIFLCMCLLGTGICYILRLLIDERKILGPLLSVVWLVPYLLLRWQKVLVPKRRHTPKGGTTRLVQETLEKVAADRKELLLLACILSAVVFFLSWAMSVWIATRQDEQARWNE